MKKGIIVLVLISCLSFFALAQEAQQPPQDTPAGADASSSNSQSSDANSSGQTQTTEQPAQTTEQPAQTASSSTEAETATERPGAVSGIKNIGGKFYASSKFKFSLKASDPGGVGVAKILYRIDGGAFGLYSKPFRIFAEGEHRVEYKAIDNLGNEEITKSVIVVIDNTSPLAYISFQNSVFQRGDLIYVNSKNKFIITASDNISGVKEIKYKINNGGWQVYATDTPVPLTTQGLQTITFKAIDIVGNESREYKTKVFVDTAAPVVKIIPSKQVRQSGEERLAGVNFVYNVQATDNESGIRYIKVKVDKGNWIIYKNPIVFSKPGKHTIVAQAWDYAGNISEPVTITIGVDALPPTTTIEASSAQEESGGSQSGSTQTEQPAPTPAPAPENNESSSGNEGSSSSSSSDSSSGSSSDSSSSSSSDSSSSSNNPPSTQGDSSQ